MDGRRRKSKVSRRMEPVFQLSFVIFALFAVLTAVAGQYYLAAAEGVALIIGYLAFRRNHVERRRAIGKMMDAMAGNMDVAAKDTMINSPLPMVIFRPETEEIIWTNDRFLHMTGAGDHLYDTKLEGVVENFSTRWLMEGKTVCPQEVTMGERRFQVFGYLVRTDEQSHSGFLATTYWVDITDLAAARDAYVKSRPVVALLVLDNYEEVLKSASDTVRSAMLSSVDQRLSAWTEQSGGLFCRIDRDRYLFIFEEENLQSYIDEKFSILDSIREVQSPEGSPVTLSVGIGRDGESLQELYRLASLSIEMALSRGGDQAVIRNKVSFEFYGGHSKELEKRTKVKSRVMANALGALISDSSVVFVMGHRVPDLDSVGAAAGVCAMARKLGVAAYVIREPGSGYPGRVMVDRLQGSDYYKNRFLPAQDALVMADSKALLVVVDTNRPDQVQAPELLESCTKVAVIDHHRRAAEYIEGAALNFHEPFASSACELVTELLQYRMDSSSLLRVEAEALMAGIMLDTKNFTMRTGGRTFEAAALLRRAGADTAEVKKLFQNDLSGTIARYDIIRDAKLYRDGVALAVWEHPVGRIPAAQAADELLNISGIEASFVVFIGEDGVTMVSARSMGKMNVQMVMEALGGGGNAAAAGAQLPDKNVQQAAEALRRAIDQYLQEEEQQQ